MTKRAKREVQKREVEESLVTLEKLTECSKKNASEQAVINVIEPCYCEGKTKKPILDKSTNPNPDFSQPRG